jgi:hypothetical protein
MSIHHRRSKGYIPVGMTGGVPYTVICKICPDSTSTNIAVEKQVLQTEPCIYCQKASTTSVEEHDMHTEVCETEVTESSPKKRRRKRDKVASSIKK